ncbi:MAG: DoxX family protein [Bryobacteraceae bacterium]
MEDSMAHPTSASAWPVPAWRGWVALGCALAVSIFFVGAGVWKVMDPLGWAAKVSQLKVPSTLSLPLAVGLGIVEIFSGVLLLVPRFRRWGALLTGGLLLVFMAYIGYHYNALRGEDCTCFPFLERAIGPQFFATDALMLAAAAIAGWWARPSIGIRPAAMVLGAVCVFAGVSYGVTVARQSGVEAPATVTVDGKPYSLREGRVFLYFFDPECSHCFAAAKQMSGYAWKDVRVVGIPTRVPQFAEQFLGDTGLKAVLTPDLEVLKAKFPFGDPPFGVALEHGRQREAFVFFDDVQPVKGLRELGYIQ